MDSSIIVLVLIGLAAAVYIVFRVRKSLKNSDCGSCSGSCSSDCKKD